MLKIDENLASITFVPLGFDGVPLPPSASCFSDDFTLASSSDSWVWIASLPRCCDELLTRTVRTLEEVGLEESPTVGSFLAACEVHMSSQIFTILGENRGSGGTVSNLTRPGKEPAHHQRCPQPRDQPAGFSNMQIELAVVQN